VTGPFYAPHFSVRVSGVTMAADVSSQVTRLAVETDLDMAGKFSITLRNPDNAVLDSALFDLGKTVEIHLGYGNDLKPTFLGDITAIEPEFPQDGPPVVVISGADKSQKLRRSQPKPTDYSRTSDSVIAARIAAENGLVPIVDPTPPFVKKITQTESDMAFLKSRARKYFFDVYVEWDRLHFQFPRPQTAAHVLEWGRNLSSFSPRISSAALAGLQTIRSYNQELAQTISGIALAADLDPDNLEEKLGSSAMDLLTSLARRAIRQDAVDNPFDAAELATSLLADLLEGMYEGTGSCVGIPDLTAGNYVAIRGVGKRFSGTYRLRNVSHVVDEGGFRTSFQISQRSQTSLLGLLRKQLVEEPSPNEPQRFYGVVLGTVLDNHELGSGEVPIGRVQVSYPGLSEDISSGWAPCVRPMAGNGTGFYALPENGEQVLVAFEHGNLARPYVLGSLWSAEAQPPLDNSDGRNTKQVIKSRAGHMITFDDTAGRGQLLIEDGRGSSIVLDATNGSITINAKNNLTISAGGTVTLQAGRGEKKTTVTVDANRVNVS
jgi:phage protein D/phage baseplate assembly protein gpV